jgi:hypothetical protein
LTERLKQTQLPGYIFDCYFNVVAINSAVVQLMDWSPNISSQGLEIPPSPNALLFVFSEEGANFLQERVGEDWTEHAFETVMLFRTVSLRYRATEHFQNLLRELKRFRLFQRCWREVYFEEKDQFVDTRHIRFKSSQWGPLVTYVTYLTALTTAGELHLCVHVPTTRETANAFSQILEQSGQPRTYRLACWPEEDAPSRNRLVPVY